MTPSAGTPIEDEFTWSKHLDEDDVANNPERAKIERRDARSRAAIEWIVVAAVALLVTMVLRSTTVSAFKIPSGSMIPTLEIGDRVLVNKLSYKLHDLHRGDVIVFRRPPGEPDRTINDLIKRVIGLPGDVVRFRDGKVYVNDQELVEPYLKPGTTTLAVGSDTISVPEGQMLVLGDNRGSSFDGRYFGTVSQDLIVGRAFVRIWPPKRLGTL